MISEFSIVIVFLVFLSLFPAWVKRQLLILTHHSHYPLIELSLPREGKSTELGTCMETEILRGMVGCYSY